LKEYREPVLKPFPEPLGIFIPYRKQFFSFKQSDAQMTFNKIDKGEVMRSAALSPPGNLRHATDSARWYFASRAGARWPASSHPSGYLSEMGTIQKPRC
jgi:hypothetical protein